MRHHSASIASAILLFAASCFAAKGAAASDSAAKPIHFSDLGGVKSWRRGEKDTIVYFQAQDSSWYRVDLYETCMKFVNDKGLRFITEEVIPGQRLSKVIADKYICTVLEITKLDAPPGQAGK